MAKSYRKRPTRRPRRKMTRRAKRNMRGGDVPGGACQFVTIGTVKLMQSFANGPNATGYKDAGGFYIGPFVKSTAPMNTWDSLGIVGDANGATFHLGFNTKTTEGTDMVPMLKKYLSAGALTSNGELGRPTYIRLSNADTSQPASSVTLRVHGINIQGTSASVTVYYAGNGPGLNPPVKPDGLKGATSTAIKAFTGVPAYGAKYLFAFNQCEDGNKVPS